MSAPAGWRTWGRWNDRGTECPPDRGCHLLQMWCWTHPRARKQTSFFVVFVLFFFSLCSYWGTNWLQRQRQMLLGRNGENKTTLIANKLHGEFSWLSCFRASGSGGEWEWRGVEGTCWDTRGTACVPPVGYLDFLRLRNRSAAGRPQRDCHNHSLKPPSSTRTGWQAAFRIMKH